MLREIKHYLREHRQVTLTDLAYRFDMPEDAVRGAIRPWIRKGKLVCMSGSCGAGSCGSGGCSSCSAADVEIYRWMDDLPFRILPAQPH